MTPIIVLNLERAPERKEIMIKQFNQLSIIENENLDLLKMEKNIHYFFLPAYDGRYMTNLTLNANIGIGYGLGRQFQKGELGIIMSQIAALKFAQMMDWDNVIVLEDDVILCKDWIERLNKLLWLLPKDWEHVYLSAHSDYVKFETLFDINGSVPGIIKSPQAVGAFSYMVNKTAYAKIIKYTTSFMTTFDDMIMYMILQGKLNSYMYFPFMTFHNANDSFVWSETPGHLAHNNTKMHSSFKYFKNSLK